MRISTLPLNSYFWGFRCFLRPLVLDICKINNVNVRLQSPTITPMPDGDGITFVTSGHIDGIGNGILEIKNRQNESARIDEYVLK